MRGLIRVVQAERGKPDAIGGLADMIVGRLTVEDDPLRRRRRATINSDQVRTGHTVGAVDPPPLTRLGR
jgi:hypothetical protein